MTCVRYDREGLRLEMEGHADAGPPGVDPVCAALSMLMMTLEERMTAQSEQMGPVISRGQGRFAIQCCPAREKEPLCRESFDTVAAGLSLLAENRPEHVSFTVNSGGTEEEEF